MGDLLKPKETIYRDEHEDKVSRERVDKYIFILLLGVIGFVPLLVGGHITEVTSPVVSNIGALISGAKGDIFSYYKFVFLLLFSILVLGLYLYKLLFLNYSLSTNSLLLFIGLFLMSIVVSTVFSPAKSIALFGQYNRTDGAITYVCYIILFFVAMQIKIPKNSITLVLYSFVPFVVINLVLMAFNFFGRDLLQNDLIYKAISLPLPEGASLGSDSTLLGTLNQWNYMSGMFAIVLVMFLSAAILELKLVKKILFLIVSLMSISIVFMSVSTSGFLTILLLIPFLIFIAIKFTNKKNAIAVLLSFFLLLIPVFHILSTENPRVWDDSIGFFISNNPYEKGVKNDNSDAKKNEENVENEFLKNDSHIDLPELPESNVSAGSGRLYIWQKGVELLKERPLIGYGLDTFMYEFPHYNIDARGGMGNEDVVVDKPHNIYLGIAFGTGLIGFISFLGLVCITLFNSAKFLIWEKTHFVLFPTLFLGWVAYLFQGIFNDNLPGTAGPMFVICGIMMGIIYQIKNKAED